MIWHTLTGFENTRSSLTAKLPDIRDFKLTAGNVAMLISNPDVQQPFFILAKNPSVEPAGSI
ncbi:hypothetical protein C7U61_18445 [Rhizobium sp. JAB6]|nr:hypothetical protein C7U61_18445 [Rhizobium sp. JAB6]